MPVKRGTVIFIVGPTAIGKTALAVSLAGRVRGEIISCDSMQVYKGMKYLSQAPSRPERKNIKHHLINFLSPHKESSAAIFSKIAAILIDDILKRKKIPIVVGGSGLYVKALIDGLFPSPEADAVFRKKMYGLAERYGRKYLYNKLVRLDPGSAQSIHPNDTRRVVRALEILHSTGKTMSELKGETKGLSGKYCIKIFGLTSPREKIYSNINARVDKMVASGAIDEVKRLSRKRLGITAKSVLGFKEILGYIKRQYGLETASELLKRNTRRFAKRQLTWFRADKRICWFDTSKKKDNAIIKDIIKEI